MENRLKYADEADKCYGIAGMAVGLVIWDSESFLSAVSLDACPDKVVEFTPGFYFSGNPRLSAKVAWKQILEHFQVSVGMLLSNVICRSYMARGVGIDVDLRRKLYKLVEDEARETCSLERDEIERMFDKSYDYLNRVFSHHAVREIVSDFSDNLKARRRMSRAEVVELLSSLNRL